MGYVSWMSVTGGSEILQSAQVRLMLRPLIIVCVQVMRMDSKEKSWVYTFHTLITSYPVSN